MNICTISDCNRDKDTAYGGCWRCGLPARPQEAAAAAAIKSAPRERGIDGPLWIGADAGHTSGPALRSLPSVDEWGNLDHGEDAE